jgi:hypothetical protein
MSSGLNPRDFMFEEHGFTRMDWERFWLAIERTAGDKDVAWEEAKIAWCEQIRADLGGDARLLMAANVILQTDLRGEIAEGCLNFADQVHGSLRIALSDLAHPHAHGRVPLFVLTDEADYYDYLSFHYPEEGTFPASHGVQISDGCPHVVLQYMEGHDNATTIVHELSHLLVSHLPLPVWVNEGVAMQLPRALAASFESGLKTNHAARWWHSLIQSQYPILADDLIERHQAFWNEENIQGFWAGTTFQEAGEPNELSYSLAETFISRLSAQWQTFLGFLSTAHYCDGGQTAALDHFGTGLGEVAECLLGPGEWRPVRKELVRRWDLMNAPKSDVADP